MGTSGAQPARDSSSQPRPKRTSGQRKIAGAAPTPLDALFILFASVFLLLLLLWIASQLAGRDLFTHLPPWVNEVVKGLWSKVLLGAGAFGTLALRKWLYKSTPSPNYLLWIPGFTILLIGALFLVRLLVPSLPPAPKATTHYHVPIRFTLEPTQTGDLAKTDDDKEVLFKKRFPLPPENPVGIFPANAQQSNAYGHFIDVPDSESMGFEAELNHKSIQSRADGASPRAAEYLMCLHNNLAKPLPADASGSKVAIVQVECSRSGKCKPASSDPGYVVDCESSARQSHGLLPVAYAAPPAEQGREPGWVVPSLGTLDRMTDRERIGYTRFYLSFTPTGEARGADRYYYILRVNGKPIYVDGFLPDRTIYALQQGTTNWIAFGLENLNFTGQYAGTEKLLLTVVFMQGDKEIYRQNVEREYVALRDAAEIPPIETDAGTFTWTGQYVVPKNENKYELFLGSSTRGDLAMNAKAEFDRLKLSVNNHPAVLVVRPPLPKKNNPNFGMVVGLVMPTSQVQFTFNAEESHDLCTWAAENAGKGPAGRLIRTDYSRYEIAADKAVPCN